MEGGIAVIGSNDTVDVAVAGLNKEEATFVKMSADEARALAVALVDAAREVEPE
jgi:hypothetical protein